MPVNDNYEGLPEKVIKAFQYIYHHRPYRRFTHFVKLDDDVVLYRPIDDRWLMGIDYASSVVFKGNRVNRRWHFNKCSPGSAWNTRPYEGDYVPWCSGAAGYVLSRRAVSLIKNDDGYNDHIYEDLYIATLLHRHGIFPEERYIYLASRLGSSHFKTHILLRLGLTSIYPLYRSIRTAIYRVGQWRR